MDFNESLILIRKEDQLFSHVDNEIVMLSVEHEAYYNLDSIGSKIWEILEKPHTVQKVAKILTTQYAVSHEQCLEDIKPFLEKMVSNGLILVING